MAAWLACGWRAAAAHWLPLAAAALMVNVAALPFNFAYAASGSTGWLANIQIVFVWSVFIAGWMRLCLAAVRDEPVSPRMLLSGFARYPHVVVANLLFMAAVYAGLFLLVIPAVMWGMQFGFFAYGITDRRMGPIAALKYSARVTRGYRFLLFELALVKWGVLLLHMSCGSVFIRYAESGFRGPPPVPWGVTESAWLPLTIAACVVYFVALVVLWPWVSVAHAAAYAELARIHDAQQEGECADG